MATSTIQTYNKLKADIAAGRLAKVYMLYGEEGYFIDRLLEDFERLVPEEERDFNLYTLYGADSTPEKVEEACRRYPMMAERVVVIFKEVQAMRADILNRLHSYVSNPTASTVLVITLRDKELKGRDLPGALRKSGAVIFESAKLKDRDVAVLISDIAKSRGLNIEAKGITMLRDFIGANVQQLYSAIDKLLLILGKGAMITPEAIERNIGISKDYNTYELIDALAARNSEKAYRIVRYFKANPKACPLIMVSAAMFNYFSTLLILQFSPVKTEAGLMEAAHIKNAWQLKNYRDALSNFNAFQTMEIIGAIRDFDCRSKGIGSRQNEHDLFQDLIFRILTARGTILI